MRASSFSTTVIYYTIYFLFALTFVVCIIIWNSNLHKNPKFNTLISLLTALTIFFTSFSIIIQIYTFKVQETNSEIQIYDTMFTNLLHDSIDYFKDKPKLNYYYNEIFRPIYYTYKPTSKRYYTEEQQVTRLMLQNLSELIFYLNNDETLSNYDSDIIQTKIDRFIKYLLRSPIFIEHYKQMKQSLLSPALITYMQTNFNI